MQKDKRSQAPCKCGKRIEEEGEKECCSCEAQRLQVHPLTVKEKRREEIRRRNASGWELS